MGALEKEILQIDGDASGAQRATQQTVAGLQEQAAAILATQTAEQKAADASIAMAEKVKNVITEESRTYRELQQAAQEAEAMTGLANEAGGVQELTDDFDDLEKAATKSAGATEKHAGAFAGASGKANVLAEVVSKLDPRLGDLVRVGSKLDDVLAAAFSPAGLMTGGMVAALTAVSVVIGTIQKSIEQTKQDLADIEAAKARIARDRLEAAGEVGKELAMHGAGGEGALERATAQVQEAETEGFERSAAVKVAGATEAAGLSLSDEERRRLTMGVQYGVVDVDAGRSAGETRTVVQDALKKMGSLNADLQAAIESSIEQTMRGKNLGALREAAKGTQGFVEEALKLADPKLEGETLKRKAAEAEKAAAWIAAGRPPGLIEAPVTGARSRMDEAGAFETQTRRETPEESAARFREGLALLDQISALIADKERQLAEQQERVRGIIIHTPPGQLTEGKPRTWGETFQKQEKSRDKEYEPSRKPMPDRQNEPVSVAPKSSEPAGVTNVTNVTHNVYISGNNYFSPKDRRLNPGSRSYGNVGG